MRMPFRVLLILAAGSLALPILAQQGAAGRWNASVETPQGPFAFSFEFAVDAAGKLTGSMNNEFFGATPIKDGVVKGNDVSFKLTFAGAPDGDITVSYTGTVKGDELALTSKLEGAPPGGGPPEQSFTAKRAP
jgi:hypothetical protein